jgi:hypothetical protein
VRQLIVTAALVTAGLVRAVAAHADGESGSNCGKITEVYVDAKVTVMRLQFSRPMVNPTNCEGGDFYYIGS